MKRKKIQKKYQAFYKFLKLSSSIFVVIFLSMHHIFLLFFLRRRLFLTLLLLFSFFWAKAIFYSPFFFHFSQYFDTAYPYLENWRANSSGESIQTCPWIKPLYIRVYVYKNTSFPHFRGPKTETIKDSTSIPPSRFSSYWSAWSFFLLFSGREKREREREKRGGDKEETKRNNKSRGKIEDKQPKENVERERCRWIKEIWRREGVGSSSGRVKRDGKRFNSRSCFRSKINPAILS